MPSVNETKHDLEQRTMELTRGSVRAVCAVVVMLGAGVRAASPVGMVNLPDAVADLRTDEGLALVKGEWRSREARLVEVDHRRAGADGKPTGQPVRTLDIEPKAGAAGFDDSDWEVIAPTALEARRSTGRFAMNWYRLRLTIPERVGVFDTAGAAAVLELVVDDYSEVWVNGGLPRALGQSSGGLVSGWNTPNRVVLTTDARPGDSFEVAVLGVNGPMSDPPANFVWIRSATVDFYAPGRAFPVEAVPMQVVRDDPALDAIIPASARLERVASGFMFTEGPVWNPAIGSLLFSDPNMNVIYRWSPTAGVSVYRTKSGYTGFDMGRYRQPGSNGLALDPQGRFTICEHGNRRVTRLELDGTLTVLADRYNGRRLNSPNDLVYRSDGALYFTDPPFGLPGFHDDPSREQPHFGVYCVYGGQVKLVSTDLRGPNGIAFSPDEQFLYVANWDESRKIVMRYRVLPDGALTEGVVFFDMSAAQGEEALDGVKVDRAGNLFVSGPGGVWIISPKGRRLGMLVCPELPANFAWGDDDRRTLYMTARSSVYRLRVNIPGSGR